MSEISKGIHPFIASVRNFLPLLLEDFISGFQNAEITFSYHNALKCYIAKLYARNRMEKVTL